MNSISQPWSLHLILIVMHQSAYAVSKSLVKSSRLGEWGLLLLWYEEDYFLRGVDERRDPFKFYLLIMKGLAYVKMQVANA